MQIKRVLLLSAYDAQSHRQWHQQLINQFSQHHWQVLALKDRHFAWRMGGNALNFKAHFNTELNAEYDLIIATSMTDLSTLSGMYPRLAQTPKHMYFHENQFAYPTNEKQQGLLEIQLRSLYAALVADSLWFNSNYNLNTFLAGVDQLSQQMPDGIPDDLITCLTDKSQVLGVPVAADCVPLHLNTTTSNNIEVVWNHRWEHDKGPDTLLEVMRLCATNEEIKFHIIGQQFRVMPTAMQTILKHHQHQCLNLGYIESRQQYIAILQQADVVLSTANHDFQGVAMLEAVACGCKPVAPNRLVYPELYPEHNLYPSAPLDSTKEATEIVGLLRQVKQLKNASMPLKWQQLKSQYAQLFE